jgi:hypothetical protein
MSEERMSLTHPVGHAWPSRPATGPGRGRADLARPDPPVAQLADRWIAVDAVAAGHQAAQVGNHEGSSRDVVGTEG